MTTKNPWQDPDFAAHHAEGARTNVYEHEVNFSSILSLIPSQTRRILDFGCGPGEYTALMTQNFAAVEGCDNSRAMLDIATQSYPNVSFFAWDFHEDLPGDREPYDVIVSKLTVQFIADMGVFAARMHACLTHEGSLIISVPHPVYTARQVDDYWQETGYEQQIGQYGIYDTMIHRSLERYISVFVDSGFVLTGLSEPKVEKAIVEVHNVTLDELTFPKRLNVRLQRV